MCRWWNRDELGKLRWLLSGDCLLLCLSFGTNHNGGPNNEMVSGRARSLLRHGLEPLCLCRLEPPAALPHGGRQANGMPVCISEWIGVGGKACLQRLSLPR